MSSIPSPNPSPPMFLDVGRLIESSQPRPRQAWGWYALLGFGAVVVAGSYAKSQGAAADQAMSAVLGLLVLGVVVAMSVVAGSAARAQKQEQQRLEAVEELVQLRRWDQAAFTLDTLLSQPTRSEASRLQALIYLASVLARYHRFTDAITVQEYLLEHAQFDPATAHGLKLMRAMAMLHEDHLFDADRAIGELRRESTDSAGLALIEMYRDVKTGHPAEAVEMFNARLPEMRNQLGGRVADAYALAAKSYDLLERESEAANHWEKATLLAPPAELVRRYSELTSINAKYPAAVRPKQGGTP
ncbi:MAG: hypothetical protein ACAI43_21160 [Phycisphaerae bacterium]|nr:hypothetical protein [Tepidisphaeraceae bacterium]